MKSKTYLIKFDHLSLKKCLISFTAQFIICNFAVGTPLLNLGFGDGPNNYNTQTYLFLSRLISKDNIRLINRGSLPLSEGKIAHLLGEVKKRHSKSELSLSKNEYMKLVYLTKFYQEKSLPTFSPPKNSLLFLTDSKKYFFAFDASLKSRSSFNVVKNEKNSENFIFSILPRVHGQFGEKFAFSTDISYRFIPKNHFKDLHIDEPSYPQFEGRLTNKTSISAYMKFRLPWFDVLIGQDSIKWGPGYRGNLVISNNPLPFDMIKLMANYQNVSFTAFTGILEDLDPKINEKFISGHRIEGFFWMDHRS